MPLFETESLVLKSYNLAEADRIVVFFTRQHGIVRGVAKGAKRLKSRFGSTLEPFSTVSLEYFQKEDRELVSIRHIDLIDSRFEIASEPEILHTFSYISDLLISFVPPHDPNETLYRMVKACIDSGSGSTSELAALRLYFELWLLRLSGYLPDWRACNSCKRSFTANEPAAVQADFHLLCANCRKAHGAQEISGIHRDTFQSALKFAPPDFSVFASASDKPDVVTDISRILKRIISNIIGREVVSEKSFAVNS